VKPGTRNGTGTFQSYFLELEQERFFVKVKNRQVPTSAANPLFWAL